MDLKEIVLKLTGPVAPIGESSADHKRFENLKTLYDLAESLMAIINEVAIYNYDRPECSMSRAGKYALDFIERIGVDSLDVKNSVKE